ncbi:hypothetical protein [Bacillus sp. EU55]|uniref:hypothetical protein n=1 Tax=Bacillus sp. EU55 TaxID=2975343 RepID=UPI0030FBC84E
MIVLKRVGLLFSALIAAFLIGGCSSDSQPHKKDSTAKAEEVSTNENLGEDSAIWAYSAEMNDKGNYDGLDIKIERILISPSSAHIAIKGSIENIGHSSFEAYPAAETIKLNTGEELGPEEVIKVVEEGPNKLKKKGDRLDFFYAWPMSNTTPNEVTSVNLSWNIYKTIGNDAVNSATFTRNYTLKQ